MRGDAKQIIALFAASLLAVSAGLGIAMYLDRILAPIVRGMGSDVILVPLILLVVLGFGWVWWFVYSGLLRFMGED